MHARLQAMIPLLLLVLLATPALASDGVLEINQTCAVQTGCFAGDTAGLPVTISSPGSYRLASNLVVASANTDGIQVGANDVTIDLAGFEIRGPVVCSGLPLVCTPASGTGSGVTYTTLGSGISVRNGSIRGMGSYGVFLGFQAEVTNLRVVSNAFNGINPGNGSIVVGNMVSLNGGVGIFTSASATISGNTVYQNGGDGIAGFTGSTISGNTLYLNRGDGIETFSSCSVAGNTVTSNTGFGLNLGTQSGYRENVIAGNGAGVVTGSGFVNLGDNACNGSTVCP